MGKNCRYCEREFIPSNYGTNKPLAKTRDHVIPISKGGNKSSVNMVDCCTECNSFKGNLFPDQFLLLVQDYINEKRRFKTIPKFLLPVILANTRKLIDTFVKVKGEKLYSFIDNGLDGEFKVVIKNTPRAQSPEIIEYLQSQTLEQFRKQRSFDQRIKNILAAPAENFHYVD